MGSRELMNIQPIDYEGWLDRIDAEKGKLISWQDLNDKHSAGFFLMASASTIISVVSSIFGTWAGPTLGAIFCILFGMCAVIFWLIFLTNYFGPGRRPFHFTLRNREERAVKTFFKENRRELKSLRRRVLSFNRTLMAHQKAAGFLDTDDVNIRQAAVNEWKMQREALVGEMYDLVNKSKSPDERRALEARRQKFTEAVSALKELVGALGTYCEGGSFKETRDVAQYLDAMAMRDRLEAERQELSFPPDALPPPLFPAHLKLPPRTT